MKRLVKSSSGRQIYSQKWQNVATSNEIESDDSLCSDETAAAPPTMVETPAAPPPTLAESTNFVTKPGTWSHRRSMYQAALEGDWVAAEMLLGQFPSLACDELTERGDRALHVAVAMEHKEFVQKLVERMSTSELEVLKDGQGHTACCYAAISGIVEMAELLIRKNPNVGTASDENKATPLQKAVSLGNVEMVCYLLESAKETDLSDKKWFDLLLETISLRNYGVALKILEKNGRIATMANEEGTALHLLARQYIPRRIYIRRGKQYEDQMRPDNRILTEKLWTEIQKLGQESAVELMKKPPMLHDAAKEGNAELITMVTQAYPDLIWHTDSDGYTIFHIAVMYRRDSVFILIDQLGTAMKDQIAVMQDLKGNNILHLAAKLIPIDKRESLSMLGVLEMKSELTWFEKVKKIGPPSCRLMKNKGGVTPEDLFIEEHRSLVRDSETWMRNTADSCLLISTIILTVVFAAAFTVPGGYNGQTGVPILISKPYWFAFFALSEAAALCTSIQAILHFWNIMMSRFVVESFRHLLPANFSYGLSCLLLSLVGTLSAIFSTYFLVYVEGRGWAEWLVGTVILCVYAFLLFLIRGQYIKFSFTVGIPETLSKNLSSQGEHSLFRRRQGNKKKG